MAFDPWAATNQGLANFVGALDSIEQSKRQRAADEQTAEVRGLQMAKARAEQREMLRQQRIEAGAREALANTSTEQPQPVMLAGLGGAGAPLPQPKKPSNPDRILLDYYAKTDPKKYQGMQQLLLEKYRALSEINPEEAVKWYSDVSGQQMTYAGKKGDYSIINTSDGTVVAVNSKDPKDVQIVRQGLGKQEKGFDTIDLGDRVKIVPRDGSAPTIERKAKLPGVGGSGGGGSSAGVRPSGKPPVGYRFTPNGDLEPIPGGPADQKVTTAAKAQEGAVQAIDTAINSVKDLLNHPGRKSATGFSSITNVAAIPGGAAKTFLHKLDTFKSQMFVPMVQQLKGMGQLSDAEGKKLTAAVGALEPSMGEQEFADSLNTIMQELYATRKRTAGPISNATTGRNPVGTAPKLPAGAKSVTGPNGQKGYYLNGKVYTMDGKEVR